MLQSIHIKNFKAFADSNPLPIKPITLFCGTNSCGKSSLLQSILLWKQSIESRNSDQSILMNGRLIHLGTFINAIHGHDIQKPICFEFKYVFTQKEIFRARRTRHRYPLHMLMRDLIPISEIKNRTGLTYNITYSVELGTTALRDTTDFTRAVVPKSIRLHSSAITNEGERFDGVSIDISHIQDSNEFDMKWENLNVRHQANELKTSDSVRVKRLEFINFVPTDITLAVVGEEELQHHDVSFLFYRVAELLRSIFGSFSYLGPLREEPSRRYIYEDEIVEIGVKGENAAYIYMAEGKTILKDHYFYNSESDTFEKRDSVTLQESVNLWFSVMGIHDFDASSESEIIRLLLNSSKDSSTQVNIADVGFGVSQIFPIVLEGLRMNPGQTLLLEQPEIHLHPRMQMQLADYLISLALAGKKVIIETHSDHIVNRLVRRMAEDKSGELAKMMGVYFVSQGDNGSKIEEVALSQKEGIVNWPEEFFDQAAQEQQRIMRALIENRKGS